VSIGVPQYLLFAVFVALIAHAASRNYALSTYGAAAACAVVGFAYDVYPAILAGKHLNLGFAPLLFSVELVFALPVCAGVGLPFIYFRRRTLGPINDAADTTDT
jgi:hypothetical protein